MTLQILSTDSIPTAGCKRGRDLPVASWQETGRACKLARYGNERANEVGARPEVRSNILESSPATRKDDDGLASSCDPLEALGVDIFHSHILTFLNSRSLARSAAVCSRWRPLATADKLWQPLVVAFLAQRAHLPLCLMGRDLSTGSSQHLLYSIAMTEARQRILMPAEMCGRTWELRLKPPCGPYWLGFDPTQVGKPGLNRYFNCDGSLSSDPGDPIWGGHACVWEFIRLKHRDGRNTEHVQINHWPPLTPRRVTDGRWVLENFYGLYITRPDNQAFASGSIGASKTKRPCSNSCKPPTYGFMI